MSVFSLEKETCPICGAKAMVVHSYYGRKIIDFIDGHPQESELTVMRIQCTSCSHTHAVLPDIIVPYDRHSLFFILRVIAEYYLRHGSVMKLCERFQITVKRLYQWLHLFKEQKQDWLGILHDQEVSSLGFIRSLVTSDCFSDFASGFVRKERKSFLQVHSNPVLTDPKAAGYTQTVFDPDYQIPLTTQPFQ